MLYSIFYLILKSLKIFLIIMKFLFTLKLMEWALKVRPNEIAYRSINTTILVDTLIFRKKNLEKFNIIIYIIFGFPFILTISSDLKKLFIYRTFLHQFVRHSIGSNPSVGYKGPDPKYFDSKMLIIRTMKYGGEILK